MSPDRRFKPWRAIATLVTRHLPATHAFSCLSFPRPHWAALDGRARGDGTAVPLVALPELGFYGEGQRAHRVGPGAGRGSVRGVDLLPLRPTDQPRARVARPCAIADLAAAGTCQRPRHPPARGLRILGRLQGWHRVLRCSGRCEVTYPRRTAGLRPGRAAAAGKTGHSDAGRQED